MNTRLLGIDCETTGKDPYRDRIVEIALDPSWTAPLVQRFNPGIPIPAEATEVHKITDADVAEAPRFAEFAPFIQKMVEGAVLLHFNGRRFDTPLLHCELRRACQEGLAKDADGLLCPREIDLYQVWVRTEKRNLDAAALRFAGVADRKDAHAADADLKILPAVLEGMAREFGFSLDIDELCGISVPEECVDRDGCFRKLPDGTVVFAFGKHRDQPVAKHADYLKWMIGQSFNPETKIVARKLMRGVGRQPEMAL